MVKIKQIDDKFYVEDNGELLEIVDKGSVDKKTGKMWYKLPENSSNRKFIREVDLVEGHELKYRETRILSARTTISKSLTDYMNEDDLKLYNEIIERAQQAREAAKQKAQSPVEKMKAQIARLEARIKQYQNE